MADYPDGITRMDDYLGAIVSLNRELHTRDGRVWKAGAQFIVLKHWRGRLTLAERDGKTLGGHGPVAIRHVQRGTVTLLAVRLA